LKADSAKERKSLMNPKIKIQNLDNSKVKIEIEFQSSEFDSLMDKGLQELSKDMEVQGFRKGKAPIEIVQKAIGEQKLIEYATQEAVNYGYITAIKENKLEIIGSPEIKIEKCAKGNPFIFSIEIFVLPKIELPDYKKIAKEVKKNKIEIDDKEIQDSLKWLQGSMAQPISKIGAAQEGDWVEVAFSINDNPETKDAFILGKGKLIPEIENNIKGMQEKETKEFEFKFPGKEEQAKCKITLTGLKGIKLPEIDDEFAKTVGNFSSIKELEENIKKDLLKGKEVQEEQRVVGEVLAKLGEKLKHIQIPQVLVEAEIEQTMQDFKARLAQNSDISFEEYLKQSNQTQEKMIETLRPKTEIKVREYLILKEIQKAEDIQVGEEEINQETNQIMQKYPDLKEVDLRNLVEYTKERLENQKTYQKIASFVEG